MPASLLASQLATLEPPAAAIEIDAAQPPERCVALIAAALDSKP
jgi:gluconate kinase